MIRLINIPTSQGLVQVTPDILELVPDWSRRLDQNNYFDSTGDVLPQFKNNRIGIRISGGADSAILAYVLALIKQKDSSIRLIPITGVNSDKPYQKIFSNRVINRIQELTNVQFEPQLLFDINSGNSVVKYADAQKDYQLNLYQQRLLDCHFLGETMNPPPEVTELLDSGRPIVRDGPGSHGRQARLPFRNFNKRAIKEIYDYFGVLEDLFPLTRSCEKVTNDFSHHCGECWFCRERYWGFGRLV